MPETDDDLQKKFLSTKACKEKNRLDGVFSLMKRSVQKFVGVDHSNGDFCFPFLTLSATNLSLRYLHRDDNPKEQEAGYEQAVKKSLEGKIVMIGSDILGITGYVDSPLYARRLPGIFYHAMATENLLSLGNDYSRGHRKSDTEKITRSLGIFSFLVLPILWSNSASRLIEKIDWTLRESRTWLLAGISKFRRSVFRRNTSSQPKAMIKRWLRVASRLSFLYSLPLKAVLSVVSVLCWWHGLLGFLIAFWFLFIWLGFGYSEAAINALLLALIVSELPVPKA